MNNIYKEGSTNYYIGFVTPPPVDIDIHFNPLYLGTGDYHLQTGSPCIDVIPAGSDPVNIDLSGTARPQPTGGNFDIGCYEALEAYTVTFVTDGTAGATLSGTLSQTVFHGGSCTEVTAVAPTGYEFVKWTLGDADYSVNNPLTVSNVTSDMALKAVFAVITYKVTFVTDGTAGATLSGTVSQTVTHGSRCTAVRAVAPAGYIFVKWTWNESDYSIANPLTVTNVTSDMTITAVFASNSFTVTFVTDGTPGARLSGTLSQTVARGGTCTLVSAVAPTGYTFIKWTIAGETYSTNRSVTVANVGLDQCFGHPQLTRR